MDGTEHLVLRLGLFLEDADRDLDPGLAQPPHAGPVGDRVGIERRHHHPRDAGREQRFGAGRGAPVVVAGLEGDVGGGAAGAFASGTERLHLGVRLAGPPVPALTDDGAVPDEHTAHQGIG